MPVLLLVVFLFWAFFSFFFINSDAIPVCSGVAEAEGSGEEPPVGPGERQDAEADSGVAGQHGPPPHRVPGRPHRRTADPAGGSGQRRGWESGRTRIKLG